MEPADQNAFHQNVPVHRFQYIGLSGFGPERQLGVQREQLERLVLIRPHCGRTHSEVPDFLALVQGLN